MLKKLLKSTIMAFVVNLVTYGVYLILRILDVISYYELEEDYGRNIHVSVFFFIVPIIITLLINLFTKTEKIHFIAFVLGILSIVFSFELLNVNCSGLFNVLKHIQYYVFKNTNEIDIFLKSVSTVLSAVFYYFSMRLGNKSAIIIQRRGN